MNRHKKVHYKLNFLERACNPPQAAMFRLFQFIVAGIVLSICISDVQSRVRWLCFGFTLGYALLRLYLHIRRWSCHRYIQIITGGDAATTIAALSSEIQSAPALNKLVLIFRDEYGEHALRMDGLRLVSGFLGVRVIDDIWGHFVLVPRSVSLGLSLEEVLPQRWNGTVETAETSHY